MSEPRSASHDENLTPETIHNTRRSFLEWVQLSLPGHRSRLEISSLPTDTLQWGLKWLRNHVSSLVEQDNRLYFECLELVLEVERPCLRFAYHLWRWEPWPEETIDKLQRQEVLGFLWAEVYLYDGILRGVNVLKREIDRLKKERVALRMDLKGPVFDQSDGNEAKDASS